MYIFYKLYTIYLKTTGNFSQKLYINQIQYIGYVYAKNGYHSAMQFRRRSQNDRHTHIRSNIHWTTGRPMDTQSASEQQVIHLIASRPLENWSADAPLRRQWISARQLKSAASRHIWSADGRPETWSDNRNPRGQWTFGTCNTL